MGVAVSLIVSVVAAEDCQLLQPARVFASTTLFNLTAKSNLRHSLLRQPWQLYLAEPTLVCCKVTWFVLPEHGYLKSYLSVWNIQQVG